MNQKPCIGLFGTCGKSIWRKPFIEKHNEFGIKYFNPQVPTWDPSCAVKEAYHLAHDDILIYPLLRGVSVPRSTVTTSADDCPG
jgi:hypothetical protein